MKNISGCFFWNNPWLNQVPLGHTRSTIHDLRWRTSHGVDALVPTELELLVETALHLGKSTIHPRFSRWEGMISPTFIATLKQNMGEGIEMWWKCIQNSEYIAKGISIVCSWTAKQTRWFWAIPQDLKMVQYEYENIHRTSSSPHHPIAAATAPRWSCPRHLEQRPTYREHIVTIAVFSIDPQEHEKQWNVLIQW